MVRVIHASILVAETLAISHALEICFKNEWKSVIIMYDCLSTIQSFSSYELDTQMHPIIATMRERMYNFI